VFTPPNVVVGGTGPNGANVTLTPPAVTDNFPPVTWTYSVPSGSLLASSEPSLRAFGGNGLLVIWCDASVIP